MAATKNSAAFICLVSGTSSSLQRATHRMGIATSWRIASERKPPWVPPPRNRLAAISTRVSTNIGWVCPTPRPSASPSFQLVRIAQARGPGTVVIVSTQRGARDTRCSREHAPCTAGFLCSGLGALRSLTISQVILDWNRGPRALNVSAAGPKSNDTAYG
jgi:hypothetical protein